MEMGQAQMPEGWEFDPGSPVHISLVLFGGEHHQKERVNVIGEDGEPVRYKSGQKKGEIKSRIEKVVYQVKGYGINPEQHGVPQMKNGHYSTEADYLDRIDSPFTNELKKYREAKKDAETYYRGYSAFVWNDSCIHPNINHESTRTGRQSSSQPNLQNVSGDDE